MPRTKSRKREVRFVDLGIEKVPEIDRAVFLQNRHPGEFPLIPWRLFSFGTIGGQYRRVDGAIELLAIENANPGNGHFVRFIGFCETTAKRENRRLRIRHFTYKRLKAWFLRRGYSQGVSDDDTDWVENPIDTAREV